MGAETSAPPGLQLSWVAGEALAWQPGQTRYGSGLPGSVARLTHRPGLAYAATNRVVELSLPSGRTSVLGQRLDAATLATLGQLGSLDADVSPSVVWFGAVHAHASALVCAGRVLPILTHLGSGTWLGSWRPLDRDVADATALLDAMPPVVAAAGEVDPADVLRTAVDQLARLTLSAHGWRAAISDTRAVAGRALRLVGRALTMPEATAQVSAELAPSVVQIAREFDLMARRADGQPIVRARLRLGLPSADGDNVDEDNADRDNADGDNAPGVGWPLSLELVDVDDRGMWCSATAVVAREADALRLARDQRFLPVLDRALASAVTALGDAVPELATWLADAATDVDIETAAALLESTDALVAAEVELVAPEQLARRRPTTRGVARPSDALPSGRLGASALMSWSVVLDDQPVSDEVLRRASEGGANLVQVGGRWVQIDRAEALRALAVLREHQQHHAEMSPIELLALAAELQRDLERAATDEAASAAVVGTEWVDDLLGGMPDTELAEGEVPPGFTATLRPYQLRGLGWLQFLRRLGLGGCLADDMGLGKTPTTLAHLAALDGPHLVVCPLSVVHNWETEAARFTPMMRVMVHHGGGRAGAEVFAQRVAEHDLVVTTYQVASRDLAALQAVAWNTVVLDEAQAVKNPDTAAARAMRNLPAVQHLALTGTPVENRLSELWSIMQIVAPGLLGNASQFRQRFALPVERDRDAQAAAELRRRTAPFLLRRTKADRTLVPDLPDKVEQIAWAPLTREQAQMYQAVVDQLLVDAQQAAGMRRRGLVLAALTRLKQICNHPAHALGDGSRLAGRSGKLARFDELVTDLLDAGEQALVFTQFREMGLLLQAHLAEQFGQQVPFLHGGVPKANRDRMVHGFQHGAAASPLLLVSLKAGGTGLNLTAASRVVHYDRWWNPAVEDQATDRAWRIGQQRSVFVHKLVCEGTVEEKIDALINDKRALADAVVGTTGEAWLSELSTDELRDLVVLDHARVGRA